MRRMSIGKIARYISFTFVETPQFSISLVYKKTKQVER